VAAGGGVAVSGATALADPTNAPGVTTGTADCGSAGMFTFVVTENHGQGTAWNVAFATSTTGGTRALFHPSTFDLTFSSPDGTFVEQESKGGGAGPVSCSISAAPFPGATLSGTVTGWITWRG
jgi:hypothetical protein